MQDKCANLKLLTVFSWEIFKKTKQKKQLFINIIILNVECQSYLTDLNLFKF